MTSGERRSPNSSCDRKVSDCCGRHRAQHAGCESCSESGAHTHAVGSDGKRRGFRVRNAPIRHGSCINLLLGSVMRHLTPDTKHHQLVWHSQFLARSLCRTWPSNRLTFSLRAVFSRLSSPDASPPPRRGDGARPGRGGTEDSPRECEAAGSGL